MPASALDTALWMRSQTNSLDSSLGTYVAASPPHQFYAGLDYNNRILLSASGWWGSHLVQLAGPAGALLAPGIYENAASAYASGPLPGISVAFDGVGCQSPTGAFYVKQAQFGTGGTVERFWAVFEQQCGISPMVVGEIRYHADVTVAVTAPFRAGVEQTHPLTFEVTATEIASNGVSLAALDLPEGATFTDRGDNTGTFTWTPAPHQRGWFTVTFQGQNAVGQMDQAFTRIYVAGSTFLRLAGAGLSELAINPTSAFFSASTNAGLRVYVADQDHWWDLTFVSPVGRRLEPGTFTNAVHFTRAGRRPGMGVFGDGHGCNQVKGSFTIKQIQYGPGEGVESLWITFQQFCDNQLQPLVGELRYNADVVMDIRAPLQVVTTSGELLQVPIVASDLYGGSVVLSASNLPPGAVFEDHGINAGTLRWLPRRAQSGNYEVWFGGQNSQGQTERVRTRIRVLPENLPPVADAGGPYTGVVGKPVVFDASGSSDAEGNDTLSYQWSFGDGASGVGIRPTHAYRARGTYWVTLKVSDGEFTRQVRQPVTIGNCLGVDLSVRALRVRWDATSQRSVHFADLDLLVANRGTEISRNPRILLRVDYKPGFSISMPPIRIRELVPGQQGRYVVRVPVLIRPGGSQPLPFINVSVLPEVRYRDCNLADNKVRLSYGAVLPPLNDSKPVFPGGFPSVETFISPGAAEINR